MAVVDQTAFKTALPKETRLPPPGELVVTPETLERLKVPDEVLLRPESVNPFMAGQWVKLTEITNRVEIKALEGDIPEYVHDESFLFASTLMSREEQGAFAAWSREKFLKIQSESDDVDKLIEEVDAYVLEMKKAHPELSQEAKDFDVAGQAVDMMLMQKFQETEEDKKEWEKRLLLAASSGNAELFNSVMGERIASRWMKMLGKLTEHYAFLLEDKQRFSGGLGADLSAADLAQKNIDFGMYQQDIGNLTMQIQYALNEYQSITEDTARTNTEISRPLQLMINNMRGGG